MQPKKLPYEEFRYVYDRVPRLNVEIVLNTPEGIVLTKRAIEPRMGQWHLPGGSILLGEKVAEAITRIAKAELGVEIAGDRLLDLIEYPLDAFPDYPRHNIGLCYQCHIVQGTLSKTDQTADFDTFTSVPENTMPEQAPFLRHYLKGILE